MTLSYMLDTNIVSSLNRDPTGKLYTQILQAGEGASCISIMTASELRFGAAKLGSKRLSSQIDDLISVLPVVPFEVPGDEIYGDIRAQLERIGRPIGPTDLFIAAHALALDLTLVTANIREFSRVPRLRVENWLD